MGAYDVVTVTTAGCTVALKPAQDVPAAPLQLGEVDSLASYLQIKNVCVRFS